VLSRGAIDKCGAYAGCSSVNSLGPVSPQRAFSSSAAVRSRAALIRGCPGGKRIADPFSSSSDCLARKMSATGSEAAISITSVSIHQPPAFSSSA